MDGSLLEKTFELAKTATLVYPFGLGEPLLYPRLAEVVGRYKSLGASVALITNGMLLSEGISRELIRKGLDLLVVSIDAADPVLFAEIRRGADLRRIADNIRTLNSLKKSLNLNNPALAFNVVAQAGNFSQLPQIIRLAAQWDISSVTFLPITTHKHIPEIQDESLSKDMAHWRDILEICRSEAESKGIKIETQLLHYVLSGSLPEEIYREAMPCPEPFRFMGIRANGDIFPCCNWDVNAPIATVSGAGGISFSDLKEAWLSPGWQALREEVVSNAYPEQCKNCMGNFARPLHDEHLAETVYGT
jgi:MoaA/NifB/PqqE/SkfB family radical SAM enzyme